jgi:hypothetical protein
VLGDGSCQIVRGRFEVNLYDALSWSGAMTPIVHLVGMGR